MESITWPELAARALRRQFPSEVDGIAGLADRIGPLQTQTARAAFLGLTARSTFADHASITAAYEDLTLVRGSSIRGTVHTSVRAVHPILDVLTRVGIGTRWRSQLGLRDSDPVALWESLDTFAAEGWRTPDELRAHQAAWLAARDPASDGDERIGRYLPFSHGSLIRRPLKGGWEGQGAPGYRTASALLGDRSEWYADLAAAVRAGVLLHVRCHGPSSVEDIAWWAGVGRKVIARAVDELADALVGRVGPDGRGYVEPLDSPDQAPADPAEAVPGVRLLPEFDALLCAYEPSARMRFVDPEHHRIMFSSANGLCRPPLLVDGRITGYWRLDGSGRTRALTAYSFAGTRRPPIAEVRRAATAVTRALPVRLSGVEWARHRD
ncbi:crosslink repair DNA glycosylase YcaQ family protein [Ammonicoccus fulvus]|uniref:Crosslink repair DNA glycosylase YcaQ family protein n=1 Tax=Ammonicoccus fulvus TaxID=3138240 RepID=A0ABZ3FK92_9ACTN